MPKKPQDRKWTAIQRLIRNQKDIKGMSARAIEAASGLRADGRPRVNASTVSRLTTKVIYQEPDAETVTGLAQALDLKEQDIWDAISDTLGRRRQPDDVVRTQIHDLADQISRLDLALQGHVAWFLKLVVTARAMPVVESPFGQDVADLVEAAKGASADQIARARDLLGRDESCDVD